MESGRSLRIAAFADVSQFRPHIFDAQGQSLQQVAAGGATIVTPTHLAPPAMNLPDGAPLAIHPAERGRWIVTDEIDSEPVRRLLAPLLGRDDQLRYVFGDREVIFTAADDLDRLEVQVRPAPRR